MRYGPDRIKKPAPTLKRYLSMAWWIQIRPLLGRPAIVILLSAGAIGTAACSASVVESSVPEPDPTKSTTDLFGLSDSERAFEGGVLYTANCIGCHGDRDGTGGISAAPRHDETGHTWHHPDAQLTDWVLNGRLGFSRMPPFRDTLSEEQVGSVLAYIKTWWSVDKRASQADISARYQEALDK